ncbi:MFS transporter [Catenuloplanes atrovinosus]|uniref:MFS family permease n=1 Tax=Catenuloplanes atrovinosus TaxID=137266 RepID=A0AAE3YG81_9ACTN|nr:MFS transporter [Catenuloplanes atrovinosus]MDR7273443.1 MFS family permease [Catenuloplanes atrovinosus]
MGGSVRRVQRRTLTLLVITQIIGGIGVAIGITVGALLSARMAGVGMSGLPGSGAVIGGALLAVPVTRLVQARGRRPGMALAYLVGALGAVLVVLAAVLGSVPLLFLGMFLFGGGTAANLQARYVAVDLAAPERRGRDLSLVVWSATIGSVAAPNLADLADRAVAGLHLPVLSGAFVVSGVAFALSAAAIAVSMRPDPLLLARTVDGSSTPAPHRPSGVRAGARVVAGLPDARLAIAAVATGHLVMVAVMSMTPVHLGEGHADADLLRIVGIVLSVHIAGMYGLSPVTGWLADRYGRRPVIVGGLTLLITACAVAGTAGHDTPMLTLGLALLGLGWSGTMVGGSTLLSESVPQDGRPAVQGLSDLVMGVAGAGAGALSGAVVAFGGYGTLTVLAAMAALPVLALALRSRGVSTPGSVEEM